MNYKLMCRTCDPIITEEGDFIPKGTPVQVLHRSEEESIPPKVECRTTAYVYIGDIPEDLSGWDGNVRPGLYLSIPVNELEFLEMNGSR